jgi:6-phosphogluconolactonase (cycloisomerase 2 family)
MTFPPPSPGPYPVQTQPRPHEIIIDPTGNFMLVPDLGADLLRIFRISHDPPSANKVTEQQTIQLRRGSTPRHGAFVEGDETTYFYILNQNINTLMSFDVTYLHNGALAFKELSEIDLLKGVNATSVNGSIMGSELVASVSFLSPLI